MRHPLLTLGLCAATFTVAQDGSATTLFYDSFEVPPYLNNTGLRGQTVAGLPTQVWQASRGGYEATSDYSSYVRTGVGSMGDYWSPEDLWFNFTTPYGASQFSTYRLTFYMKAHDTLNNVGRNMFEAEDLFGPKLAGLAVDHRGQVWTAGDGGAYVEAAGTIVTTTNWNKFTIELNYSGVGDDGTTRYLVNDTYLAATNPFSGKFGQVYTWNNRTNYGGGGNNHWVHIDDLTVEAVPEPATLLAFGAGLAAFASRRRKS
jgi:hypothetical protein